MKKKCADMQAKLQKMKVVEGQLTEMASLKERLQHMEKMMAHFLLHGRVNPPSNESNEVDDDETQAPNDYEGDPMEVTVNSQSETPFSGLDLLGDDNFLGRHQH
ncbi:uncharacterized protein [Elaeis guineensis]|uniref:uncharacterized protein n=1 Tax=Elaeis guineensis var. tenera TaxID=51953 RepID=UPI003C6CF2F4